MLQYSFELVFFAAVRRRIVYISATKVLSNFFMLAEKQHRT